MTDCRDTASRPCCCICGMPLRGTAWTCFACRRRWGLGGSMKQWPPWARFLASDEQARRRLIATERTIDIQSLNV